MLVTSARYHPIKYLFTIKKKKKKERKNERITALCIEYTNASKCLLYNDLLSSSAYYLMPPSLVMSFNLEDVIRFIYHISKR